MRFLQSELSSLQTFGLCPLPFPKPVSVEVGNRNKWDERAGESNGDVGDVGASSTELHLMQDDGRDSASSRAAGSMEILAVKG